MLFLWIGGALAACPATSADLTSSLEAAEAAFGDMDTAGFLTATNRATAEANCLTESVPRSLIARLHRVEGLRAFVDKDADRAARAFASARAIEPAYTFPEALVPAEHPVRTQYTAVDPAAGGVTTAATPTSGYLTFDGRNTISRPTERPSLAQLVADDGAVSQSRYLWPEDTLFTYPGSASVAASTGGTSGGATSTGSSASTATKAERKGPNVPLAIAGGAALLASGATFLVANGAHSAYYADDVAPGDLEGLRSKTNTFVIVSAGTGVAAVGLGIGAVVAGHW